MKFKEQSFTLFAYTNYRTIQGYRRLETLDFKGKGAFHHSLVQWGLSMFFVEQPSHVETVVLMSKVSPGVHFITIRKVRKTAAGEGFRPLHVINDNSYCRALLRMTASSLRNHMLGSFPSSNRPVSERC